MRGRLIVFEGTDGSGKATQARLLAQRLEREAVPFREIDFPRYGNPFAQPAKLYLEGRLGSRPEDVNAYASSTFFAVDRYASYREDWGGDYEAGKLILANRYTTSNAVHQASKLDAAEREAFLDWLFDLEYCRLGLPEPDLVLYLDLPTEISGQMLRLREAVTHTQADIHEKDAAYLRQCRQNAAEIVRRLGWQRIDCSRCGAVRTPEDIHGEVWRLVRQLLERT